jgi:hypothetical protein
VFKITLQIGLALAFFLGGFIFASRRTFGNLLTSCMQRLRKNSGGDSAKKATARHLRMTLVLHPWAEIRLRRETRWKRCLAEHVLLVSVLSQPGNSFPLYLTRRLECSFRICTPQVQAQRRAQHPPLKRETSGKQSDSALLLAIFNALRHEQQRAQDISHCHGEGLTAGCGAVPSSSQLE